MKRDDLYTRPRKMMKSKYCHTELSAPEVEKVLAIWAEAHGLLDFEPTRCHFYLDKDSRMIVHFYGPNEVEAETLFEEK